MTERRASMEDKVYRGDVVKFIRDHVSLDTFMKRTVQKADEACWELCDKLNYVPAIEERKTGKWNKDGFCTVCGKEAITEWNDCGGETAFTKFCPNCGARMET